MGNNRDVLASAGVADGTPLDTFFAMQGSSCFVTQDDLFEECLSNDEDLTEHEDLEVYELNY